MAEQNSQKTVERGYLIGLAGALAGCKFLIEGERTTIGRDPNRCDIVIELPVISNCHAALEFPQEGSRTIKDLGSRNGTFVNGEAVKDRELRDGDRIGFGPGGVVAFIYHAAPDGSDGAPASGQLAPQARALREQLITSARLATTAGPPAASAADTTIPATNLRAANLPALRVGRAPDNDVLLDTPGVSRYHASLTYDGGAQPILADLGSTNGTFVNGEPVTNTRALSPDDLIFIGGFVLRVDGRNIKRYDLSASRISAWHITKQIAGKTILKDISLAISPREFVGLMGPSGCGKSTLMDALNALRPATSGAVYINDLDLYRNFDSLRRSIGHVPQRDILHDTLTVERTLHYAAKLRLPDGTPPEQVRAVVDEVINTVGLGEQRLTQFRQLSGGQQKRLSLAIELITKPSFIFLDEPTSPLDPQTTENLMLMFRRLADEGRIVVMVTHKFEKFDEMHQVAILTRGGRLAFFGPPREALAYFGCQEPADIYRRIGSRDPDELSRAFEASPQYRRYVSERIAEAQEVARTSGQARGGGPSEPRGAVRRFGLNQWLTLTRRYLEIKLKDTRNTALLLVQAPVIAIMLAVITGNSLNDAKTLFIAAVISIWFGANNAMREIVSESSIYVRERLVNLKIPSYVFSKFAVLSAIAFTQCALFVGILVGSGRLSGGDFFMIMLILYLASLGGISMGLFFSALVNSTEKAMSILPLILIPQLLLSGFLKPLDDLYVNARTGKPATAAEYKRFEDSKDQPPASSQSNLGTMPAPPDPVSKSDGMGPARYAGAAMIARWSIEALAHTVSIDDTKARDQLATRMTVAGYEQVLNGHSEKETTSAYRERVLIDLAVLCGFVALFLGLTMWALKRKDVL